MFKYIYSKKQFKVFGRKKVQDILKLPKYSWNLNFEQHIDAEIMLLVQKAVDKGIIDKSSGSSLL